ncbi:MAG TPA: RNA methyltransferase [Anaerolineales bacterium]|nr:RNA methyltransferase [Anaerolineales bacterium]
MITSSQNPKIKLVHALLGRAKERRQERAFVAEGIRLVEEAETRDWKFRFIFYDASLNERGSSLIERLLSRDIDAEEVSEPLMKSLSDTETPQGILAVLELAQLPVSDSPDFVLIPDQIRDPGNLGTLLRTAAAAGVQAVFLPPETTDAFAPKVVRSGMGAHFRLPIQTMKWEKIQRETKGLQIYLADMDGKPCWEVDLCPPLALIVGNEAGGASEEARQLASQKISIPMAGNVESLNASVAGSVLMFEVVRQRT